MLQTAKNFDHRLGQITKRHERAANGTAYRVSKSGLIVATPRRFRPRFPFKGVALLIVSLVAFKGFLLAYLGPEIYAERVAILQNGSLVEQAGAWVLRVEPATTAVAQAFTFIGV